MSKDFTHSLVILILTTVVVASFSLVVWVVPNIVRGDDIAKNSLAVPLTAIELAGRDIYISEGCHVCHTQMVRPLRAEVERYGPYSRAGESTWDHPFLWGSKRTGPDLARVGGRYSDDWQRQHLINPRSLVPESVMPAYPWLAESTLDGEETAAKLELFKTRFGLPYSETQIELAKDEVQGKTELDALVAYLQQLGHSMKSQR